MLLVQRNEIHFMTVVTVAFRRDRRGFSRGSDGRPRSIHAFDLDLVQRRPQLAGDEQAFAVGVPRDAVQDVNLLA